MYSEFKLDTSDGEALFCRKWLPQGETKAVMVLIHGKGENTGRYMEFGQFLADNGIAVTAGDLRGHGLSSGKVGHTAPREKILDDIDLIAKTAEAENPGKPLFIYGHSMGGHLALDYRRLRGGRVRAFIISSPWLYLKKRLSKVATAAVRAIAKVMPYFSTPTSIDISSISSIEEEQQRYAQDKSINSVITAATYRDIDSATKDILKDAPVTKTPFLLLHGSDDTLIDVEGSRLLAQLSGPVCTYKEFPGSRHEILNDVGKEEAKRRIVEYISEKL